MLSNLLAARAQMAVSLGFHIVFAAIGVAMPFLMATAHYKWLRTGDPVYLRLTKAWSKGVAILFATGAVSGTVLSFELGLLWPGFMKEAGAIIGMPFSLEGFAFFSEAIFLGVYLHGWKRIPPFMHWLSGVVLALSGGYDQHPGDFDRALQGRRQAGSTWKPLVYAEALATPQNLLTTSQPASPLWPSSLDSPRSARAKRSPPPRNGAMASATPDGRSKLDVAVEAMIAVGAMNGAIWRYRSSFHSIFSAIASMTRSHSPRRARSLP